MRSSAAWGSDVEPGCLEQRQRWTFEGEEAYGASGINLKQTQTRPLPWGALSASTERAPSVLSGRRAACKTRCFIVVVCLCVQVLDEKGTTCKGVKDSRSILPFGTWDCLVFMCFCISEGGRGVKDKGLKGSIETLMLPLEPGLSLLDWKQISPSDCTAHSLFHRVVLNTI